MPALPQGIDNAQLERLLGYWDEKRGQRSMPGRHDIEPRDIPDLLPHVYLVDVSYDPLSFRFRLAGTEIVGLFGEEVTGKTTDELQTLELRTLLRAHYEDAIRRRAPVFETATFEGSRRYLVYKRLLLPLSSDGEVIDMLLGCTVRLGTHELQGPARKRPGGATVVPLARYRSRAAGSSGASREDA